MKSPYTSYRFFTKGGVRPDPALHGSYLFLKKSFSSQEAYLVDFQAHHVAAALFEVYDLEPAVCLAQFSKPAEKLIDEILESILADLAKRPSSSAIKPFTVSGELSKIFKCLTKNYPLTPEFKALIQKKMGIAEEVSASFCCWR